MPPRERRVRIAIADDHPIFRDGLRRLLAADTGLELVGEAATGQQTIAMVARARPDILLLDLSMPDGTGLDVLRALETMRSSPHVVLLTASIEQAEVAEAMLQGARGVLLKDAASALLFKCIRCVMAGEYWLGKDRLPALIDALRAFRSPGAAAGVDALTERERTVVAAVRDGATNREIAQQMGLSPQTVKNYLSHIYDKLAVSNRLQLARLAAERRILDR